MPLTARQLAHLALSHQEPPCLPWTLYLAPALQTRLEQCWGPRATWDVPPDDLVRLLWEVEVETVDACHFRDRFGCLWQRSDASEIFMDPPLTTPDAALIPACDFLPASDLQRVREARAARPDAFLFYQFTAAFGERLWNLRGLEQTLEDYLLHPAFVHQALDRLLDMHLEALDRLLPLDLDGITFGDDFGCQRGLMISPRVFREFFRPRYQVLYDHVRAAGKAVGHHSCGDNSEIMADLVDMGLQVFHPLQPECMDIAWCKREFGRHLTFRGGIGTQGPLVLGTPEQAAQAVRDAVAVLAPGGGYFLETAKPLPPETPLDNAVAIIQTMVQLRHQWDTPGGLSA